MHNPSCLEPQGSHRNDIEICTSEVLHALCVDCTCPRFFISNYRSGRKGIGTVEQGFVDWSLEDILSRCLSVLVLQPLQWDYQNLLEKSSKLWYQRRRLAIMVLLLKANISIASELSQILRCVR